MICTKSGNEICAFVDFSKAICVTIYVDDTYHFGGSVDDLQKRHWTFSQNTVKMETKSKY